MLKDWSDRAAPMRGVLPIADIAAVVVAVVVAMALVAGVVAWVRG